MCFLGLGVGDGVDGMGWMGWDGMVGNGMVEEEKGRCGLVLESVQVMVGGGVSITSYS